MFKISEDQLKQLYCAERKSVSAIAKQFSVSMQTVKNRLLKLNIKIRTKSEAKRIYFFNENFFSEPNILNSYWAGFIAADFHIRKSLNHSAELSCSLCIKDKSQLDRLMSDISHNGPIRTRQRIRNGKRLWVAEISITSQILADDLAKNFDIIGENKSERLTPPVKLSRDCALSFVVGYIDGDGWLRYKKNQGGINLGACGTRPMMLWLKGILDKELISCDLDETFDIKRNKSLSLWLAGSKSVWLAKLLDKVTVTKMDRKIPRVYSLERQMNKNVVKGHEEVSRKARLSNYGSGYKGVRKDKRRNSYEVIICLREGKRKYIGSFSTAEEAAKHYDYFMLQIWGKETYLNFPNEDYSGFMPQVSRLKKGDVCHLLLK